MKHKVEGETIAVRDCVLLKSGPNSDDIPYLAKITALWEKDGKDHWLMTVNSNSLCFPTLQAT